MVPNCRNSYKTICSSFYYLTKDIIKVHEKIACNYIMSSRKNTSYLYNRNYSHRFIQSRSICTGITKWNHE